MKSRLFRKLFLSLFYPENTFELVLFSTLTTGKINYCGKLHPSLCAFFFWRAKCLPFYINYSTGKCEILFSLERWQPTLLQGHSQGIYPDNYRKSISFPFCFQQWDKNLILQQEKRARKSRDMNMKSAATFFSTKSLVVVAKTTICNNPKQLEST